MGNDVLAAVEGGNVPPAGNTGAQITGAIGGAILDWLRATLTGVGIDVGLALVSDLFGEIQPLDRGFRGYSHCGMILAGGGFVAWDYERLDMGVHVDISARGLGELARLCGGDICGVLRYMVDLGFKFGRVDLAFDDHEGLLDMDTIAASLLSGDVSTRWQRETFSRIRKIASRGDTINIGSRASDACLRIYDKAAQQGADGHCVRCELELKHERAHAAVELLLSEGVGALLGVLRSYIEFKEPGGLDSCITRRRAASWWLRFLSWCEKCRLSLPSSGRSLDKVAGWLSRQVAPSLALLMRAESGAVDWLYDLIRDGDRRLKDYQLALLPVGA